MPTRPRITTLTNSSVDILNAIRNSASQNYQDYVPYATPKAESIRAIGAIIMDFPALQNEFLNALINRIGRTVINSKLYKNPWAVFKKGELNLGETIEEVFVDLAKPFQFDQAVAESELFKREIPDVRSAFHIMNYRTFYKTTISQEQLRQAFLSWDGITSLIAKITESLYSSAAYDEFQVMKYLLALHIYRGQLAPTTIPAVTGTRDNIDTIVSVIKGVSNNFEFMKRKYNLAGVANSSSKERQYLIVSSAFDSLMSVKTLAAAFNMNEASFAGHKILTDSFGEIDVDRLDILFANDNDYHHFTSEELAALDAIPAVLIDSDYFMIVDNLTNFSENFNGQGLYWNYFLHNWKTFSISPFANATMLIPATPAVSSVAVSPTAVTVAAGSSVQITPTVTTTNYAPQTVVWSLASSTAGAALSDTTITVDERGIVKVGASTVTETFYVFATSTFDSTKKAYVTVTVS